MELRFPYRPRSRFTSFYRRPGARARTDPYPHSMVRHFVVASLVLAGCAGCTVGPDYKPPPLTLPAAWSAASADAAGDPTAELALWWQRFGDPQLTALIERGVRGNLDLRVAEARVREARAQ